MTMGIVWVAFLGLSERRGRDHNDVGVEAHALAGERGQALGSAIRRDIIDRNGLPVDVSEIAQAPEEGPNRFD